MKKYLLSLFLTSQVFAIGGIGVYGMSDMVSRTPSATSDDLGLTTMTPGEITNHVGVGGFVYLDILPIDIELSAEVAAIPYNITIDAAGLSTTYDVAAARGSLYFTLRKQIFGVGIPFLAKAQLFGGLGVNQHSVTPDYSIQFIESTFSNMDIEEAANQDFSNDAVFDQLKATMDAQQIESSGFHVQLGLQAKILMLNMFVNGRYTIANDVAGPGSTGFPSAWVGLAFGI